MICLGTGYDFDHYEDETIACAQCSQDIVVNFPDRERSRRRHGGKAARYGGSAGNANAKSSG